MEGNLTKGPILKTLTKLAVPIMASSFLEHYTILQIWHGSDFLDQKQLPELVSEACLRGFTRVSFDVENGRTGTGSTMHWTRRQRRSP